jgi:hypothetical protein
MNPFDSIRAGCLSYGLTFRSSRHPHSRLAGVSCFLRLGLEVEYRAQALAKGGLGFIVLARIIAQLLRPEVVHCQLLLNNRQFHLAY